MREKLFYHMLSLSAKKGYLENEFIYATQTNPKDYSSDFVMMLELRIKDVTDSINELTEIYNMTE